MFNKLKSVFSKEKEPTQLQIWHDIADRFDDVTKQIDIQLSTLKIAKAYRELTGEEDELPVITNPRGVAMVLSDEGII